MEQLRSIILVGMPGSGKSTVARQLSRTLALPACDTDQLAEARIGMSIRDFFDRHGEAAFRDLETELIAGLDDGTPRVVATGGGSVLRPANRAALRRLGHVMYLRASPEELYRRLRNDRQRPLLQVADPQAKLRELYRERDPLYRDCAHFVIDTGRPSVAGLMHMVLTQLEVAGLLPPARPS
jgi:shikimate kinase